MSPGRPDPETIRRHLAALDSALQQLRRHAGRDAPDYASAIDGLAVLGVLPRDFAQRLRAIAGFRNVLVHGYLELDVTRLHRVLSEQLDDFVEFADHVERYLARSGEGEG